MKRVVGLVCFCVGLILILVGVVMNVKIGNVVLSLGDEYMDDHLFNESLVPYSNDVLLDKYPYYDFDGDNLNNKKEIEFGTDVYKLDTDGDGISDYDEVNQTKTDPLKWSSRDDDISDLEYTVVNNNDFEKGYSTLDSSGYRVYLNEAKDRLFLISKVKTSVFDNLETISEAYQIKNFNGKMVLDCSKYVDDVVNSISIYKIVDGKAQLVESVVETNNLLSFIVSSGDIFCAVYSKT